MSQITTQLRLLITRPPIPSPLSSSSYSYSILSPKPRTTLLLLKSTTTRLFSSPFTNNSNNSKSATNKSLITNLKNRAKSTLAEKSKEKMEQENKTGFNKRRAEGRDKSDKPKNLLLKTRKLNPVNSLCYVQILGTGMDTQDTLPSVLLFFDRQRFIFNAGEGLQRFCTEHKIKLSKIDHIFLSRVCTETAGGLPGLLLTLAGMGDEGMCVNMWGPSDLSILISAMKTFIPNAAMVHTHCFGPSSDRPNAAKSLEPIKLVEDDLVKISAILLQQKRDSEANSLYRGEADLGDRKGADSASYTPTSKSGTVVKPGDLSVIYVCELPEIRGKFDPQKAKELGVKPGPKYRELQLGNSVKSDLLDTEVHPSQVMEPPIPGPVVLLVDCPTSSHLESLLSADGLNAYYTDIPGKPSEEVINVTCVIHLSPSSITSTPEYQRWMKRIGGAQHVMAGHERKNIEVPILKASARISARLNYLCPQFFPAPGYWTLNDLDELSLSADFSTKGHPAPLSAENLLKFHLRPLSKLGLDRSSVPGSTGPADTVKELLVEIPEIEDAAQQLRQLWAYPVEEDKEAVSYQNTDSAVEEPWLDDLGPPSCLEGISREDMEFVLLGTGSSQPSKYRNVSAIYVNLFSKGSLLFDCGEGTLGQLKRRFGVEGADNALKNLKCIWISHIHADHHTGLARILALRRDLLNGVPHEPLLVIGPGQLLRYLNAYERLEELDMLFLDCRHTTQASWDAFESDVDSSTGQSSEANSGGKVDGTLFAKGNPMQSYWKAPGSPVNRGVSLEMLNKLKKVLQDTGLEQLISFRVVHCPQAYGVVLKATARSNTAGKLIPGWKIVYSGDTRPCPELIEASRGATVLIHEATFEDSMVDEAIARNHSTTKEAIEVGEAAGVYRILLTHFSQRYPKIPVFEDLHMRNTCIGFDMMSINMADLPVLPKVLPHLKLLFKNEMAVDEHDEVLEAEAAAS